MFNTVASNFEDVHHLQLANLFRNLSKPVVAQSKKQKDMSHITKEEEKN